MLTDQWYIDHGLGIASETAEPRLCWIDLETTGLDADRDVILEFGMIITDEWGNIIPGLDYHSLVWEDSDHYRERIEGMDSFVVNMHAESGLAEEITKGENVRSVNKVQREALTVLTEAGIAKGKLYLAGSSVHFDKGFLDHYMYGFVNYLHYRQLNVSSFKITAQMLNPELYNRMVELDQNPFAKHRSMADLGDSINEYRCYTDNFLYI